MALAASCTGVFSSKRKLGALVVLEAVGLPRRFRVAVLASGWAPKLLESFFVGVVAGMAGGTCTIGRFRTKLLGVAFVAIDFAMGPAQIELGSSLVVELVLLKRAVFG